MTQQKIAVIDALREAGGTHPTAETVYLLAKKRRPSIAMGTVYRNLSLMADAGEIRRITVPDGADRFDIFPKDHFHIICSRCARIYDIPVADAEITVKGLPAGVKLEATSLVMECICPACGGDNIK